MTIWIRALCAALALTFSAAFFTTPAFAQPAVSSALPGGFVRSAAERALDGDIESLIEAFVWDETPQGHGFWQRQYNAGRLSTDGRAVLSAWVYSGGRAGVVSPGPLPEGFLSDVAEDVLDGDISVLIEAFVWGSSAQGHEFWQRQANNGRLSAEGRTILNAWIEQSYAEPRGARTLAAGPMPPSFVPGPAREALDGDISALMRSFVWGQSNQGHDYWAAFQRNDRPLSPEAAGYLRDWITRYERGERGR